MLARSAGVSSTPATASWPNSPCPWRQSTIGSLLLPCGRSTYSGSEGTPSLSSSSSSRVWSGSSRVESDFTFHCCGGRCGPVFSRNRAVNSFCQAARSSAVLPRNIILSGAAAAARRISSSTVGKFASAGGGSAQRALSPSNSASVSQPNAVEQLAKKPRRENSARPRFRTESVLRNN